ncbi:uncharacterized protein TEOVI_000342200 [Trypanosoma equiperdum]|uniref:Uncharacterized protein n=2 Tax=Trypanozoon TaxID=39700 RepID=Q38CS3_TRYB2|nr:hypothetical protein, unlikely [Trypanosoma brucei brucei TREU927]EAN77397.1 hypothetical protein, unlikely [Trypanosoma brucei brucei TREU927]SCU71840.1 hypothetical protein, conserved [Trypanosoma equiperdum]
MTGVHKERVVRVKYGGMRFSGAKTVQKLLLVTTPMNFKCSTGGGTAQDSCIHYPKKVPRGANNSAWRSVGVLWNSEYTDYVPSNLYSRYLCF